MAKKKPGRSGTSSAWKRAAAIWVGILLIATYLAAHPDVAGHWKALGLFTLLVTGAVLGLIASDRTSDVSKGRTPKSAGEYVGVMVGVLHRTIYGVVIVTSWMLILFFSLGLRFAPLSSEPIRVPLEDVTIPWERQKWATLEKAAPLIDSGLVLGSWNEDEWVDEHYVYPLVTEEHPAIAAMSATDDRGEERRQPLSAALGDVRVVVRLDVEAVDEGRVDLLAGRSSEITGILHRAPPAFVKGFQEKTGVAPSGGLLMLYVGHTPEPFPLAVLWIALAATAMGACIWHWRRIGLAPKGASEEDKRLGPVIVKVCFVLMVLSALFVGVAIYIGNFPF